MRDPENPSFKKPMVGQPERKAPLKIRLMLGCDKCHQDFEWTGTDEELQRLKRCPKCRDKP